jgi:hypothetical protein
MPGDPDGVGRWRGVVGADGAVGSSPRRLGSDADMARDPSSPSIPDVAAEPPAPRRSRGVALVAACFLLGVAGAGGWAWKTGKIGTTASSDAAELERYVSRATSAMFKNRFIEPPSDNVKDITDEGLHRWPAERRLLDIRTRAASELTSQATTQRSSGDVLEALKLAKAAHDLDPSDPSAKRLVDQYEAELASFSPSAAPTLARPADRPPVPSGNGRPNIVVPGPHAQYKALVDVSQPTPRLGQPVDFIARVAPAKAEFDQPGFVVAGPGVPGGIRVPATVTGPGLFKASYAFLEPGRFEITFSTQADGKPISAKRSINAATSPPPGPPPPTAPSPPPPPPPAPTGSVKWM